MTQLIEQISEIQFLKKFCELKQYIANNQLRILDYNTLKDQKLIFTNNLVEGGVKSLNEL